MVAKGIPAVVSRPSNDAGPQRVEIYVSHTVYESLSFLNDDAFKPISPEIVTPVMPFVVIPGKANFLLEPRIYPVSRWVGRRVKARHLMLMKDNPNTLTRMVKPFIPA